MATTELTPPTTSEPVAAPAAPVETERRGLQITFEQVAYIAIGLLALIAHLWGLGDRALHHDETLHAYYSWRIYVGEGYIHDPLLHGPFLYYLGSLLYFLFGDNDFTARLGVALFGTVLTLLPYLVRREMGRIAALSASVYLLISPTFLYVGRFFRHDMYSLVFEMLVFVAIARYASTRQARWLYLGAAAFALMYTNQETSYLFLLIMATPLFLVLLWRVFKPGILMLGALGVALALLVFVLPGEAEVNAEHAATRDPDTGEMVVEEPGPIFGWGPLETEDNTYALNIRNRADTAGNNSLFYNLYVYLGQVGLFLRHPAILTGILLLFSVTGALVWLIWYRRNSAGQTAWQRAIESGDTVLPIYGSLVYRWRWLIALLIFFAIYTLLFTAFFTNIIGVVSGTTGSLLYWLAQHNVERGGQPPYYYLVILSIYEPLALFWSTIGMFLVGGGLLQWSRQRAHANDAADEPAPAADDPAPAAEDTQPDDVPASTTPSLLQPVPFVSLLLAWWVLTALGIYSWAGEKMPWLTTHVALPMALFGAWAFQQVMVWGFRKASLVSSRRRMALFGSFFALVIGLGFIQMTVYLGEEDPTLVVGLIPLLMVVLIGLLVLTSGLAWGWRWSLGALALCLTLTGGVYSVRNAYRAAYELGDVPREMLIYTQTSPDVMRIARRLEELSRLRTSGLHMPIAHDDETVWSWYLRDFTNTTDFGTSLAEPPGDDVQVVLMMYDRYLETSETRSYLDGFVIQRYPLRWWFPEGQIYRKDGNWQEVELDRASLLTRVMRAPFNNATQVQLWEFLMHRDPGAPLGSTDFVVAVRPELADQLIPGVKIDE
jgi:predicted membrane-bound mannosyltransferase